MDPTALHIRVGTASGQSITSASTCDILIPQLPSYLPTTGHAMPGFQDNLVVVGPMCDDNFTVTFSKHAVNIYSHTGTPIIISWRETDIPRLWRMYLLPNTEGMPPLSSAPYSHKTELQDFSAYDLPSVEALVWCFRAAAGFPVGNTWLKSVKAENFALWLGLAYQNLAKSCPISNEILEGHMVPVLQWICSTKTNPQRIHFKRTEATSIPRDTTPSHEMNIRVKHISKLYTGDTGRFPVRSQSGNQYIIIVYHCDSSSIITAPFKSFADKHRLLAYGAIMQHIKDRNILVDLQILDNKSSTEYKGIIKDEWGVGYQLVPPNIHSRNEAECAIRTFK